jgi:hypothetical protein
MATSSFVVKGTNVESLYTFLRDKGIAEEAAGLVVSEWLAENLGKRRRSFQLRTPFPETVADCKAAFQRSFSHTDWVDGESVVQAGETPTEEGFNKRFHAIEDDLDNLKKDLETAFKCLADMRAGLRALLNELVTEINTINSLLDERVTFPPISVAPGVVSPGKFAGYVKYLDRDLMLWDTDQGLFMLPKIPEPTPDFRNPRFNSAGLLQRKFIEDPRIRQTFPQNVSVKELVARFGNEVLPDGRSLREVVDILPPDFTAANLDDLVNQVADREAGAIRTVTGMTAAVKGALGLDFEGENVAAAPVERATFLPPRAGAALTRAGVPTIERLAGASPAEVAKLLSREGVSVTSAEVAEWQGTAKTLARLG